jgi:hypothetical protein
MVCHGAVDYIFSATERIGLCVRRERKGVRLTERGVGCMSRWGWLIYYWQAKQLNNRGIIRPIDVIEKNPSRDYHIGSGTSHLSEIDGGYTAITKGRRV